MKVSEMIEKLSALQNEVGDVEVTVTDGLQGDCYKGGPSNIDEWGDSSDYEIISFEYNGKTFIDIGIGGCLEEI